VQADQSLGKAHTVLCQATLGAKVRTIPLLLLFSGSGRSDPNPDSIVWLLVVSSGTTRTGRSWATKAWRTVSAWTRRVGSGHPCPMASACSTRRPRRSSARSVLHPCPPCHPALQRPVQRPRSSADATTLREEDILREDPRSGASLLNKLPSVDLLTAEACVGFGVQIIMGVNTANLVFGDGGDVFICGAGHVWRIQRKV